MANQDRAVATTMMMMIAAGLAVAEVKAAGRIVASLVQRSRARVPQ